jgi:hypothetical protein
MMGPPIWKETIAEVTFRPFVRSFVRYPRMQCKSISSRNALLAGRFLVGWCAPVRSNTTIVVVYVLVLEGLAIAVPSLCSS